MGEYNKRGYHECIIDVNPDCINDLIPMLREYDFMVLKESDKSLFIFWKKEILERIYEEKGLRCNSLDIG